MIKELKKLISLSFVLSFFCVDADLLRSQTQIDIVEMGFIYDEAPFPSCHASTIIETDNGDFLTAWFGGTDERDDDVDIWMSRYNAGKWTEMRAMTNFPEIPTWNPVLYAGDGKIWLNFKIGPSPQEWIAATRHSSDDGKTWSKIDYLPAGLLGPVRAKPITLDDGTILAGSSFEAGYKRNSPSDAPYRMWSSWVNRSQDGGRTWSIHGPLVLEKSNFGTIQPALWQGDDGKIHAFMRTTSQQGFIAHSVSHDNGLTWSPAINSGLPNPSAGVDVVKMNNGKVALIYNHLERGRNAIHLAFSHDDGQSWEDPITLEAGEKELSYPAMIEDSRGNLILTYTHNRSKIRFMRVRVSD